jgi:hypothetical protein
MKLLLIVGFLIMTSGTIWFGIQIVKDYKESRIDYVEWIDNQIENSPTAAGE